MDRDESFELRGKKSRGKPGVERRYLGSVLEAWSKNSNFLSAPSKRPRFVGNRMGRGCVAARALTSNDRFAGFRARHVFVNCRVVRFRGKAVDALRSHLRYLRRDGATREGEPGRLYSAEQDCADGNTFVGRCAGDRHHFRLVVAADDGAEYEDLKPLVRRFMQRMEQDLGTRLEWVAANHADTLVPHTHMVIRGKDELGENLIIAPAYIYRGMRQRLGGIVSLDLGPPTDLENVLGRSKVEAEQLTPTDRQLLREMDSRCILRITGRDTVDHATRAGRLRKLESLGLASELGGGRWQLADDLERTLRGIERRHEIARLMRKVLKSAGLERAPSDRRIHCSSPTSSLTGRVMTRGLANELGDVHYVMVDGVDGKSHYIAFAEGGRVERLPEGAIIRICPCRGEQPGKTAGSPNIILLSPFPLEQLVGQEAATWLDEELSSPSASPREQGFGREVHAALAQRRAWLIGQGLASFEDGQFHCRADMLEVLKTRGLQRSAEAITQQTGLVFRPATVGSRVEGTFRQRVDLAFGRFAVIEDGFQFSLVPWRPAIARAMGERLCGLVSHDGQFSWTIARSRQIGL